MSALADVLREEGGLLAAALAADPPPDPVAEAAAAGRDEYALLVAAIHEGHLLHVGASRTVTGADPDLALLAGDRLFALGLDRLAELGDLEAVAELADTISVCAISHSMGRPDLAEAAWHASAAALAYGRGPDHPGAAAVVQGHDGAVTGLTHDPA